ncbi:tetratricopeptide repeat protein [Actinoallomurus sp. CA-150999]|uniref:nSTAND1 domain-containing NTPase n=1 Tax=Actinoallomurus sp. CA-150999 TaxID=3239887 RepID=UPI003D908C50
MRSLSAPPGDPDTSPYPGLRPFTEADRGRFFGRDEEIRELARMWRRNRVTILYGESGVGKTSLIVTGVRPRLAREAANVLPIGAVSRAFTFPTAAIPEYNPYTLALLSSWSPIEPPTVLSGRSIGAFLRRQRRTGRFGEPLPTLVAIDQAERLFRNAHPDAVGPFFDELIEALAQDADTHLLLSVREDHLEDTLRIVKRLGSESCAEFPLLPLDPQRALAAVVRPLEGTGRRLDPALAAQLIDELEWPSADGSFEAVEPVLLQVVCRSLWERLPTDVQVLTDRMLPDIPEALESLCSHAVTAIAADHDRRPGRLVSWLRDTFLKPPGQAAVREGSTHTAGMANAVVHSMEDRYLIKARRRDGARWYELRHPLLIAPIRRLVTAQWPVPHSDPAGGLRAAKAALSEGDVPLARRHAAEAVAACGRGDMRIRGEAESLLGNIANEKGDLKGAIEHYRRAANIFEALQETSAVGRLLAAMGRLRLAQGKRGEAVEDLEAAVGRMPNDPTVQTGLGRALWDAGQPKAALAVLDGVLRRDGDALEALRARGEILADLGEAASALRDLDRIDRRTSPSARAARALALATLSKVDAARRELDDTVAEATGSGPVLLRAARVEHLCGDLRAAARLAARALKADDPPLPPHQQGEAVRVSRLVAIGTSPTRRITHP